MLKYTDMVCTNGIVIALCLCVLLVNYGTVHYYMNACASVECIYYSTICLCGYSVYVSVFIVYITTFSFLQSCSSISSDMECYIISSPMLAIVYDCHFVVTTVTEFIYECLL